MLDIRAHIIDITWYYNGSWEHTIMKRDNLF